MKRIEKKLFIIAFFLIAGIVCFQTKSMAKITINLDGDPSDWEQIEKYDSSESCIEKWALAKDDDYVYMYILEKGGNKYNLPISQNNVKFNVEGENVKDAIMITDVGKVIRNQYYGEIKGASVKYEASDTKDCYEMEIAIPLSFFGKSDFSITSGQTKIKSDDIPDINDIAENTQKPEAAYTGISIDGNFADWQAVDEKTVKKDALDSMAAVFDGDWLYLLIKEDKSTEEGSIGWSGESGNGHFTIKTDTNRNSTFKVALKNGKPEINVEGASIEYSNRKYELAIPKSFIKEYKQSISISYYATENEEIVIVDELLNLQGEEESENKNFAGISYDGLFGDWSYYPHSLIEYSTSGGNKADAEGALWTDDDYVYGHVTSYENINNGEFQNFSIKVNDNANKTLNVAPLILDDSGKIVRIASRGDVSNLEKGVHEYYLIDYETGESFQGKKPEDVNAVVGKIYVSIGASKDEFEYIVDMEKLAQKNNVSKSDLKDIKAKYIQIGNEWVAYAGTSTGPLIGIGICALLVFWAYFMRQRKLKKVKEN